MNTKQMLDNVETQILDGESSLVENVGNRPHYPLMVSFYGSTKEGCTSFYNTICGTWTRQICENLLFYRYARADQGLVFYRTDADEEVPEDTVFQRITRTTQNGGAFDSLKMWCLFNVIDTSYLSFEEFEAAYHSLGALKYVIDDTVRSMVIIILRDSRERDRKQTNYRIREFLMQPSQYDSVIVFSNRSRGNGSYDLALLYRVVANIVLLADNDAVSHIDDNAYRERVSKLYSQTPYSVAFTSVTKPTRDILYCMTHKFIDEMKQRRNNAKNRNADNHMAFMTLNDINNILGISNNRLTPFSAFINAVCQRITKSGMDREIFQYMPLSSKTPIDENTVETNTYANYKHAFLPGALQMMATNLCREETESPEFRQLFAQYEYMINSQLNLLNVESITMERVDAAFSNLQPLANVNENDLLPVYFRNLVTDTLVNQFIYPKCIALLKRILDAEVFKQTDKELDRFITEVNDCVISASFDDITSKYGSSMTDFLRTEEGNEYASRFLKLGNTYDDLLQVLKEVLLAANVYCKGEINMPFIDFFVTILKMTAKHDMMPVLKAKMEGEGDQGVMLRGAFPVLRDLCVFMLHCYDAQGENPTELFNLLDDAYENVSATQFFNTGNNDAVDVMKLYKVEGSNLILGLNVDY